MPCNSSYMEANDLEVRASQVACLLNELGGQKVKPEWRSGYHPSIYGKISREDADRLVSELCSKLHGKDISDYSLEMQIWWRDHQKADEQRKKAETATLRTQEMRKAALAKLTPAERKALGIED